MTNAKVIIEFQNLIKEYDVTWEDDGFAECENIAEQIFFSTDPEIDKAFSTGEPEMSIVLNEDNNVKSQVIFDNMASLVYPVKNLEQAKQRANKININYY